MVKYAYTKIKNELLDDEETKKLSYYKTYIILAFVLAVFQTITFSFIYYGLVNHFNEYSYQLQIDVVNCLDGKNTALHRCQDIRNSLSSYVNKNNVQMFKDILKSVARYKKCKYSKFNTSVAHVTGNNNWNERLYPNNYSFLGNKITSWSNTSNNVVLSNSYYIDGEIIVTVSGLYYIYAQTYFKLIFGYNSKGNSKNIQMVQYIYKNTSSYGDPLMLMKSARSNCWDKTAEYGLYSVYQGGIHYLKKGDSVFVTVTNKNFLAMDYRSDYFGAFLIK
ncbi:tnfsf10-like protein [Pteropox virus]|uniref:Tnfsf10-like protein n=1 Tax=Pteropox virus TaxID=1873698 RepID=A0A1B1MRB4_9POXV|nr:tnfsf10-like protein [Pteropox virus]ANS71124.1 tnfsf10-like protein [Pteropox virus]